MSYATVEQLADALQMQVTSANTQTLQDCLAAAADEIDHIMADLGGWPVDPVPALVGRVNINRAVEWWKAPATYNGGVGTVDIGVLNAPSSGFGRHAAVLYALTPTGASGVA